MLTLILSSALTFAGKRHYATHQEYFNPVRLEKKAAKQDMRKAQLETLRARAAESQAAVLAAEETLQRKEASLERLKNLFRMYDEHQKGMQQILAQIGLEKKSELTEAVQEVQVAQAEVAKEEEKAQVVTEETNTPTSVGIQPLTEEAPLLPNDLPSMQVSSTAGMTPEPSLENIGETAAALTSASETIAPETSTSNVRVEETVGGTPENQQTAASIS